MHDLVIRAGTVVDGTGAHRALYGLHDCGVLAPGKKADCNVIDFAQLRLEMPEQLRDLLGGAGRLVQRARGYVATFVSGVQTVDNDERTDGLPGRLVRGACH